MGIFTLHEISLSFCVIIALITPLASHGIALIQKNSNERNNFHFEALAVSKLDESSYR